MLDRSHIENFLRLNGIDATEPDEVVRSALIGAQWHEKDVEVALLVLRENVEDHTQEVTALHKVFRSDDKLSPETISSLLGVDLSLKQSGFQSYRYAPDRQEGTVGSSMIQIIAVIVLALVLGVGFTFLFSIGPFYSPV